MQRKDLRLLTMDYKLKEDLRQWTIDYKVMAELV
jgi:hypothetical protein